MQLFPNMPTATVNNPGHFLHGCVVQLGGASIIHLSATKRETIRDVFHLGQRYTIPQEWVAR